MILLIFYQRLIFIWLRSTWYISEAPHWLCLRRYFERVGLNKKEEPWWSLAFFLCFLFVATGPSLLCFHNFAIISDFLWTMSQSQPFLLSTALFLGYLMVVMSILERGFMEYFCSYVFSHLCFNRTFSDKKSNHTVI